MPAIVSWPSPLGRARAEVHLDRTVAVAIGHGVGSAQRRMAPVVDVRGEQVVSGAAVQPVAGDEGDAYALPVLAIARAAVQPVVAAAPDEVVGAEATAQAVVALRAPDVVVAAQPDDHVGPVGADQPVVTARADDGGRSPMTGRRISGDGTGRLAGHQRDRG